MTPQKKTPATAQSSGRAPKGAEVESRNHYLPIDLTAKEREELLRYCTAHEISVSQFVGELARQDALHADETLEPVGIVKLPRTKRMKLNIFAKRRGKTTEEFIREILEPFLDKKQLSSSTKEKRQSLRCYLTEKEHSLVMDSLNKRGLAARNYLAELAISAIRAAKAQNKK